MFECGVEICIPLISVILPAWTELKARANVCIFFFCGLCGLCCFGDWGCVGVPMLGKAAIEWGRRGGGRISCLMLYLIGLDTYILSPICTELVSTYTFSFLVRCLSDCEILMGLFEERRIG